jgi:hypothetical protein
LFADDTSCTAADSNLPRLIAHVNVEIQKLANWFRDNKMAVNVSKTKFIIFHRKGKRVEMNDLQVVFNQNEIGKTPDPSLITPLERIYNGHINKECRSFKLLGVHLDETLSFSYHIDSTANKISKALYCINKAKNFLSKKALKSLYFALIHPHLLYCSTIYSIASPNNLKRLELLQKRAIRTITKSSFLAHTQLLFSSLNILPLTKLISYQKLMFMHSIEYQYHPSSFTNVWQKNSERNQVLNVTLRNENDYYLPRPKIDQFKRIPLYSLPHEWNLLPHEIRLQFNRFTFKTALKRSVPEPCHFCAAPAPAPAPEPF